MYPLPELDLFALALLCLGVICRCPDFIRDEISKTSFHIEDEVGLLWVSTFELFSLLPACTPT